MHTTRQSNVEIFRIVATIMIVVLHCNGWFLRLKGVNSWYEGGLDHAILRTFIQSCTCIGVDCFVIISGYFSIKPKKSSLFNLFSLLAFFYVGTYLYSCISEYQISFQGLCKSFMVFSHENWFIQCYLFLILLAPVLNAFVDNCAEKTLTKYIGIFVICATYFGCYIDSKYFYFNQGYSVTTLILVYLIGRWIRLYGEEKLSIYSSKRIFAFWLLLTIVMTLIRLLELPKEELYLSYCSPFLLTSTLLLFILFLRVHIQSKLINNIAKSCLAVFILHTCTPLMWKLIDFNHKMYCSSHIFVWTASIMEGQ